MSDKWQHQFAALLPRASHVGQNRAVYERPTYHHVHPFVEGHAHCSPRIRLEMETLASAVPEGERYCSWCRRLEHRYAWAEQK